MFTSEKCKSHLISYHVITEMRSDVRRLRVQSLVSLQALLTCQFTL